MKKVKLDGGFPVLQSSLLIAENKVELTDRSAAIPDLKTAGNDLNLSNVLEVEQNQLLEIATHSVLISTRRFAMDEFRQFILKLIEICWLDRVGDLFGHMRRRDKGGGREHPVQVANGLLASLQFRSSPTVRIHTGVTL